MRSSRWFFLVEFVLCAGFPKVAMADMEGRVPFVHVHYDSLGIENSGPIKVDAFQDEQGVARLEILAFGSTTAIAKPQLGVIDKYKFNSIGVSYSRGYSNVGGRTVYVLLYQAFSSGSQAVAMVVIREHGAPTVTIIKP